MEKFKNPKFFPYLVVGIAGAICLVIIQFGHFDNRVFSSLLFVSAMLSLIYGVIEVGLCFIGMYDSTESVHQSISRAISGFGMTVCFMLMVAAYEASKV